MSLELGLILALAILAAGGLFFAVKTFLANRALKVEYSAARQICDLANDPVIVANIVDGKILESNPAACALLGQEQSQLLNKRLPDLHPKNLIGRSAEVIADIWEKKGLRYSDLPFVDSTGEVVDVEISANLVDFRGQPAVLIFARDIRARLEAERKIRAYAEDLERTNKELHETQAQLVQSEKLASIGNLAAGVAHEINNPIGTISANLDVTQRALKLLKETCGSEALSESGGQVDAQKVERAIRTLERVCGGTHVATDRISAIVHSLKNFARLDEAERKKVDLHEGIDSAIVLLQHELGDRVSVQKNYGELPEVECFPNRINQVYMNILMNAIQAIDGKGTITIDTKVENDTARISFSDTGRGIDSGTLPRIFEPGFSTKGSRVGAGLGLSTSYRILEDHGGRIEAESEVGKGSTFTLLLPLEGPKR